MSPARPTSTPRVGLALVGLVLLAGLAGCSALSGPADPPAPSETATAAPLPTERVDDETLPAGLARDDVTDAESLRAEWETATAGRSYVERTNTTVRFPNGTVTLNETFRTRHEGSSAHLIAERRGIADYREDADALTWNVSLWSNGSFSVGRLGSTDGEYEYTAADRRDRFVTEPRSGYLPLLDESDLQYEGRRSVDGTTRYVFRLRGVEYYGPWSFGRFVHPRRPGSGTAVFDADGVLRRLTVTVPVTVDGENATLRHRYRASFEPTTVTRPAWFERAKPTPTAASANDTSATTTPVEGTAASTPTP